MVNNIRNNTISEISDNLSDIILTDKTLMSSKDEDKKETEKEKENGNENDYETMN